MIFKKKSAFLKATSERLKNLHINSIDAIQMDPDGNFVFDTEKTRKFNPTEKPLSFATYDNLDHFEPLDQTSREYLIAEKCLLARLNEESKNRFVFDDNRVDKETGNVIPDRSNVEKALNQTIVQLNEERIKSGKLRSTTDPKTCTDISFAKFRNLAYTTRNKRTFPAVDYAIIFSDDLTSEECQNLFESIDLSCALANYYERYEIVMDSTIEEENTRYWGFRV